MDTPNESRKTKLEAELNRLNVAFPANANVRTLKKLLKQATANPVKAQETPEAVESTTEEQPTTTAALSPPVHDNETSADVGQSAGSAQWDSQQSTETGQNSVSLDQDAINTEHRARHTANIIQDIANTELSTVVVHSAVNQSPVTTTEAGG